MKKLYVLIANNGDGSNSIFATFDKELVEEMEEKYENGELNYERWTDGDGFNYQEWNVPDECTAKTMNFRELKREYVFK